MIRLSQFVARYATSFLAVLLFTFGRCTESQCPSIQLARVNSVTSGGAPHIDFIFTCDITSFGLSSYRITTISNQVSAPSVDTPISASPISPNQISVPLDLNSFAAKQADSAWIAVTLGNITQPALFTTPVYILDLSFLAASKTYQSTISSLQQSNQKLQTDLTQSGKFLDAARAKLNPKAFNYQGAALVGADTITLHFTTDVYATVQGSEPTTNQTVSDVGTDHYLKFTNLLPSKLYTFTAVPLDATTGKPIASKSQDVPQATAQHVNFSPTLLEIVASGPTELSAPINFDPNHALPAGFKSYIKLFYQEELADGTYGPKTPVGDGGLDAKGIPSGTAYTSPYTGPQKFPIPVPHANTNYLITFTAFDQYGEEIDFGSPGQKGTTPAAPPALAFDGPITLSMNTNTGLKVSWKANKKLKSSALQIKFADGTYLPDIPPAAAGSTDSSVTIDLNGLSALLSKAEPNPTKAAAGAATATTPAAAPEFDISMDDGTNSPTGKASIAFTVSFVIASTKNGTSSIQTSAAKVATASQKNGKITWTDVISTGLGIIAKVI